MRIGPREGKFVGSNCVLCKKSRSKWHCTTEWQQTKAPRKQVAWLSRRLTSSGDQRNTKLRCRRPNDMNANRGKRDKSTLYSILALLAAAAFIFVSSEWKSVYELEPSFVLATSATDKPYSNTCVTNIHNLFTSKFSREFYLLSVFFLFLKYLLTDLQAASSINWRF
jgi:hypothetical protein